MTFNDVETARQTYLAKSQATSKKRQKYGLITGAVVLIIDLLILALNFSHLAGLFSGRTSGVAVMLIIVPALIVLILEAIFIVVGVYFATGGNNTVKEYQDYKHAYKGYFIARQLASVFTDLEYSHDRGLDRNFLSETGLIYTGDRYSSNDLVRGRYKQVGFAQADVKIERKEERKDQNGRVETYYLTVFKGRYLIFEFPKKFDFKMVVSFHGYSQAYVNPKTGRGLKRVEMESPEFNKRFLVYAEDGFEAFYILNPALLDNLEKLGQKYHNQLALYFSDHKLYIGLNDGGDAFEPPNPAVPLNEAAENAKILGEMQLITELVDSLKLTK